MLAIAVLAFGLLSTLLLHELGHALAAVALGGRVVRVRFAGLGAKVEADLPSVAAQRRFLCAGAGANVGVAAVLAGLAFVDGWSTLWAVSGMHLLFATFALVPAGSNDGARLRALRASAPGADHDHGVR